jgi:serine/threonine-protein kinase
MGSIWAARLRSMSSFERLFAIKVMLPEFANDEAFRAMLLDEGRIAASLLHPNVAQVLDVGEHAGAIYLAMEWIDGDTLQHLHQAAAARSPRLPLGIVLRILADACAGLHAAHELRDRRGELLDVVHRDVSPHNIVVTTSGTVKLIDFGIAKARGRAQQETCEGEVKGKLRYMAPEQAQGKPLDRRADIWAMGAVLHFALTGEPPYSKGSDAAALYALVTGKARDPLPPSTPSYVAAIVDQALALDPAARFPTAHSMKEALEASAAALGVKATTAAVEAFYMSQMRRRVAERRATLDRAISLVGKRTPKVPIKSSAGAPPIAIEPEPAVTSTAAPWIAPSPPRNVTPLAGTRSLPEQEAHVRRPTAWLTAACAGAVVLLAAWRIITADAPTASPAAAVSPANLQPPATVDVAPGPAAAPSVPVVDVSALPIASAAPERSATPVIRARPPRRAAPKVATAAPPAPPSPKPAPLPELSAIDSRK